jgi:hypothetical protein
MVGISTRDPLPPASSGCLEFPSNFCSPPGFYPLGIVALNPIRIRGAYSSRRPVCPSLPAHAAFYHRRELIIVRSEVPVRLNEGNKGCTRAEPVSFPSAEEFAVVLEFVEHRDLRFARIEVRDKVPYTIFEHGGYSYSIPG